MGERQKANVTDSKYWETLNQDAFIMHAALGRRDRFMSLASLPFL